MEITVTSREMIKPSSPTPPHLKHLNLSLIDQHMPPISYVRILFFFSSQGADMSNRLKKSMSQVLTHFYPLAGTFNNNKTIHCNDEGLEYIEARVRAPLALSQLLARPRVEELDRLVPSDAYTYGTGFKGLSAAQVTVFEECGSMTVAVSMSHVLGDASSIAMFVNSWAAIARGDSGVSPEFGFASLFPPRDIPSVSSGHNEEARGGQGPKLVVKRFVFDQAKINALKAGYSYTCSRVEAVSMLIFKCINSGKSMSTKSFSFCIGINLRSKITPPLPAHCFGNLALPWMSECGASLNDLGVRFWKFAREYDSDYVKTLLADNALLLFEILEQQNKLVMNDGDRLVTLTSWCRFPFYEVDFGWGAPIWATAVYSCFPDSILLMDGKKGGGIEAWVTLEEEDMAQFESNNELLDFACLNPMVCEGLTCCLN